MRGMSRQAVVQAIQRGSLAGYGIRGPQRTRWFVYRDAVESSGSREEVLRERIVALERRCEELENALTSTREISEAREKSRRLLEDALRDLQASNIKLLDASMALRPVTELTEGSQDSVLIPSYPPGRRP